jgi:FtsH-binding integral membrane protein
MLGVYNNMVLGLAVSALVALGVNMLAVADSPGEAVGRLAGVPLTAFGRGAAPGAGLARTEVQVDQGLRAFMLGVYNNMTMGLAVSALVALGVNMLAVADSPGEAVGRLAGVPLTQFGATLYTTPLMWIVALAPLAFIFFFSFRMDRMSAATARTTFLAFAAVMGASLSTLLIRYTGASVVQVFFITAAAFGGLSLYGYTTQRSLSGMGSFLLMGLIGLIIASLVNIFLASSALQFAISLIGVLIFAGLTAYDTQKLKEMYLYGNYDGEAAAKVSIFGALTLYLDFINMFQFLLALFGQQRSE